jgi:endonuclease YncB( thermonuclease family)
MGLRRWLAIAAGIGLCLYIVAGQDGTPLDGEAQAIDGDSLRLAGRELRLRGIDAPELHQDCTRPGAPARRVPCGRQAREAMARLLAGRTVHCTLTGQDRYGRDLARCALHAHDGKVAVPDLAARLVLDGWALAADSHDAQENEARAARRGIWAFESEPPSEWRRKHPRPPG